MQGHFVGVNLIRFVFIGLSFCTFNGCATLVFDRYDEVDIVTEPAGVEIYDSEGFNLGITPVQIPFKRLPRQQLILRKDGYVDTTVVMSTSINRWATLPFLASIGNGTLVMPVADILLGGIFKKNDNPYVVRMKKRSTSSTATGVKTSSSSY